MIEVKNASFGYNNNIILDDISFSLGNNEIMTILGENGIGKTTLLKCILGILKWKSGCTYFEDKKIKDIKNIKTIGYVPQAHSMSFSYTVREIITMGRAKYVGIFGIPSKVDKEKVDKAMKEVGIEYIADKPCNQLSGGQLQLAFIARALVCDPKLIILDEPESHLDFKNQFNLLKLIEKLVRNNEMSAIINTHYPEHALRISDKSLLFGKNKYIFGKTDEVLDEENIKEYFKVKSKIIDLQDYSSKAKAFVILDSIENNI